MTNNMNNMNQEQVVHTEETWHAVAEEALREQIRLERQVERLIAAVELQISYAEGSRQQASNANASQMDIMHQLHRVLEENRQLRAGVPLADVVASGVEQNQEQH